MNGIKMKDCKFYVDEANRTVVCVIPTWRGPEGDKVETRNMVLDFIEEHFDFPDLHMYDALGYLSELFMKELRMPRTFMGKAVCAPEDEWDEELGRKIAFSRAKDKCYKSFFKRANKFIQTMDRRLGDIIDAFNDFYLKLEDKRQALQTQINEGLHIEE